jgi:hypothetical protein
VPHRSQPLNPPTSSISPAATKNRDSKGRTTDSLPSVNSLLPGSAQNVEFVVTRSKQTVGVFLPGSRIVNPTGFILSGVEGGRAGRRAIRDLSNRECDLLEPSLTHRKQSIASRPNRELSTNPCRLISRVVIPIPQFLTGSGSQTEFRVTHSKQSTDEILTGARIVNPYGIHPERSRRAHYGSRNAGLSRAQSTGRLAGLS